MVGNQPNLHGIQNYSYLKTNNSHYSNFKFLIGKKNQHSKEARNEESRAPGGVTGFSGFMIGTDYNMCKAQYNTV